MERERQELSWVTPAKYVGPVMVGILLVAGVLAVWFAFDGKFGEATVTLLLAACFLLVGIADLLGGLIMLAKQRTNAQRV